MSSKWELDDGIKSIKSAWQREHTARANLEKMLENAEAENAKLRELVKAAWGCMHSGVDCYECRVVAGGCTLQSAMRELGVDA